MTFHSDLNRVDWPELKATLARDEFDNGRSPQQLHRSFANCHARCFASAEGRTVGTARVLSDGVCNAYLVDVWTLCEYRNQGIAREMIRRLLQEVEGQHVYLSAEDHVVGFYEKLGFEKQPHGMSKVVGEWLVNDLKTDGSLR